jgi:hypothetical protein
MKIETTSEGLTLKISLTGEEVKEIVDANKSLLTRTHQCEYEWSLIVEKYSTIAALVVKEFIK